MAVGANVAGAWGTPCCTFMAAIDMLAQHGFEVWSVSGIYESPSLAFISQPDFQNAVVVGKAHMGPVQLIRLCHRVERLAGRRIGSRWGPRSLDIDIVAMGGRVLGFKRPNRPAAQPGRRPNCVVLPHPEAHRRAFVLLPLAELAEHWVHPVLKRTVRQMVANLPQGSRRKLQRVSGLKVRFPIARARP